MERRSVWRSRKDDPRTILGWLFQDLDTPVRYLGRCLSVAAKLTAVICFVRGQIVPGFFLFSLSSIPAYLVRPFWLGRRSLNARVTPLLTLPAPDTPYPCHVEIFRRGFLLGKDQGVVTFVDGWLHYEGLRTSFSLQRTAVSSRDGNRLELAEGGTIHFYPQDDLIAIDLAESNLKARFGGYLGSWMKSDAPAGESLLPPAAIHASGMVHAWTEFAVASVALAVVLQLLLLYLPALGWPLFAASPFFIGFLKSMRSLRRASIAAEATRALPATS